LPTLPNIVFFHCDSMDGRLLGSMGHPAMRNATPNLDALAQQGTMFRTFYCNSPICVCSRASMLSGRFTHHCEAWNNYKGLDEDDPNLFTHFDAHGWRSRLSPRTDYVSGRHTIRARVSAWTRSANIERPAYNGAAPRVIESDLERVHEHDWQEVERAGQWLREHGREGSAPFLLYLSINAPHPAFVTSRRYLDRLDLKAVDIPPLDEEEHPVVRYSRISRNWTHGYSEEMVRLTRSVYMGMVSEVDAMVGESLRALRDAGLADSTYFVFSSDHGELALEHQLWYKMSMYEGAVRIPFIAAGPGIRRGAVIERPASLVDLYPTFMGLAGLPRPSGLDGHSLWPELNGQPSTRPDRVFAEYHDTACNTGTFMLRRGDWKYIAYAGYAPQLFDLRHDPAELRNLASARPEIAGDMEAQLRQIVDYDAVDAKVKGYDRRCFRRWRQEQRSAGTYEASMARIYSGWDDIEADQAKPWTEEDEARIVAWMDQA
jgi:choline-sulfatase